MTTTGTTQASIVRAGEKSWIVQAPEGSIAMLHDYRDPAKPVPLGLYYIHYEIQYTLD
jgi:hypothetical protein